MNVPPYFNHPIVAYNERIPQKKSLEQKTVIVGEVLQIASDLIRNLGNDENHNTVKCKRFIVRTLALKNSKLALEIVEKIPAKYLNSKIFKEISGSLLEIHFEAFMNVANKISRICDRALVFSRFGKSLAISNPKQSVKLFDNAISILKENGEHEKYIAKSLLSIADELPKKYACEIFEMAVENVLNYPYCVFTEMLYRIASRLVLINPIRAQEIVEIGIKEDKQFISIDEPNYYWNLCEELNLEQFPGETNKFQKFLEFLMDSSNSNKDRLFIAKKITKKNPELVLKFAETIQSPRERAELFFKIGVSLQRNNPNKAEECFCVAVESVKMIPDIGWNKRLLNKLIKAVLKMSEGKPHKILQEAIDVFLLNRELYELSPYNVRGYIKQLSMTNKQKCNKVIFVSIGSSDKEQGAVDHAMFCLDIASGLATTNPTFALKLIKMVLNSSIYIESKIPDIVKILSEIL